MSALNALGVVVLELMIRRKMQAQEIGERQQLRKRSELQLNCDRRFFGALFLLAVLTLVSPKLPEACAQGGAGASLKAANEYVMDVDDVLEIVVRNYDDLKSTVTIRPDGKITLPRAGEIQAAGLTTQALALIIETELKKTLRRPSVTVTVKEVRSQKARVLGAVKAAGVYDLKPNWRVMDLVAVAGGLSTKPIRVSGRVIRAGQVIPFDVAAAVQNPQSQANVRLQANDLVYLEEQYIERLIHVVGAVAKPGAFDLEEGLSVVELLARAGDANPEASLRKAHVLRNNEKIPLDLQAVLVDGVENPQVSAFKFQSGDVLVIPENNARFGVMGEVVKPQYYPLPDKNTDATVVKALAAAGGPKPEGDLRQATITRTSDGTVTVIPVNIDAILKGEVPDNIYLRADDTLNIPLAKDQVHILGKVAKPGVYKLKEGTGPLTLLSEAGSPEEGAALQKAYVLRGETQIPLDLNAVLNEGRADPAVAGFKMISGDILVIPENQVKFGVMGQVAKPGYYPYPERKEEATVLNALAAAGGPSSIGDTRGDLAGAGIIRMVDGKATRIPINLEELLRNSGKSNVPSAQNIGMEPNDILYIPTKKRGFNWATVLSPLSILSGGLLR